ncbi:MAG: serine/threonine protein kinase [Gemmatimonadetes bacterium]|nr:serine/threonine protein kinase [Gemmatimonadota bacterium]
MEGSPPAPPPGAPPEDPLIGTVLAGRYRILRRLGAGAMGSVYLGEHLRFGRHDAIKVLQGNIQHDRAATERFLRGARNASAINHPHVCTVYDFGDTDEGHQFLAMEFVDGVSLADVIDESGPVSLERGIEITRQIGDALDAAHHLGIVHRDLKPGNVMLTRDRAGRDHVKVVDFDIAKGSAEGEGSEVTRTGFVVGTPEYMSPEQLTGDPLDGRSDVYSLALVFARIITGKLPFRSTTTQNLMVERLTEQPLRLSDIAPSLSVPPAVQSAVDHALERRREDRPASAGEFTAALRGAKAPAAPARHPSAAASAATATPAAGVATPAATPPGAVPETRVGAPPLNGQGAAPAAKPAAAGRKALPLVVGGIAVLAVGYGLIQFVGGGGADEPSAPTTGSQVTAQGPTDAGEDVSFETRGDVSAAGDTVDTEVPPAGGTGTRAGEVAPQDDVPETPASTRDTEARPAEPPEAVPPTGTILGADQASEMLQRMEFALEPSTYGVVTDSAMVVWNRADLPDRVRAHAAFVLAQRYGDAGNADESLNWARRATVLDPVNEDYALFLRLAGGIR